jgi:hypothetical protein
LFAQEPPEEEPVHLVLHLTEGGLGASQTAFMACSLVLGWLMTLGAKVMGSKPGDEGGEHDEGQKGGEDGEERQAEKEERGAGEEERGEEEEAGEQEEEEEEDGKEEGKEGGEGEEEEEGVSQL